MIDLSNLDKWIPLAEGQALRFDLDIPRRVRLEVNTSTRTRFDLVNEDGETTFLANIDGHETLQFVVKGPWSLYSDTEEGCYIYTKELETTAVEVPDAVIFTKIASRRARNPELEYMMQKMAANLERRLAIAEADIASRVHAQYQAANNVPSSTPPANGTSEQQSPSGSGEENSGGDSNADSPAA